MDDQEESQSQAKPESSGTAQIYYSDRTTLVMLGDFVKTRIWFRKRYGRIVYVPGYSRLNPEMERDGLKWVGIRLDNNEGFVAQVVDPIGNFLIKPVILLKRDKEGFNELSPEEDPFGNDSFPTP